eukprot:3368641-Amphidinium_carterae.1
MIRARPRIAMLSNVFLDFSKFSYYDLADRCATRGSAGVVGFTKAKRCILGNSGSICTQRLPHVR